MASLSTHREHSREFVSPSLKKHGNLGQRLASCLSSVNCVPIPSPRILYFLLSFCIYISDPPGVKSGYWVARYAFQWTCTDASFTVRKSLNATTGKGRLLCTSEMARTEATTGSDVSLVGVEGESKETMLAFTPEEWVKIKKDGGRGRKRVFWNQKGVPSVKSLESGRCWTRETEVCTRKRPL